MAKVKVYELAKELDKQSKEIIAMLQDKGIEVKAAQSSVEEDVAEMVRSAFGAKKAPAQAEEKPASKEAPKAPAAKEAPVEKEAPAAKEAPAEKEVPAAKEAPAAKAAPAGQAPANGEIKKKKKIIIVSNNNNRPGNNRQGGNGYNSNGGYNSGSNNGGMRRPGQGGYQDNRQPAPTQHRIIRPTQKPIPVNEEPYEVRQKRQLEKKEQERRQANEMKRQAAATREERDENANLQTAPQTSAPIQREKARPAGENGGSSQGNRPQFDRNQNPNGNRPQGDRGPRNAGGPQGDRRSNGNFQGGAKPGFGGDRNPRSNDRPDNRFRNGSGMQSYVNDAPAKDTEKRAEDKRRSYGADKDKKSKKDHIYEDEDNMSQSRKAGRFIKPEKKVEAVVEEQIKVITVPDTITLKDLADKMKMQPSVIIKKLFLTGKVMTLNSEISFEEAENIAIEYDIICEKEEKVDVIEELLKEEEEDESKMVKRPPVVCVMGHVDHGKTSLLDAIRKTNVTDKEAGGITQAIGAYTVNINGEKITFLDTPGHEAFTAMRMRGANSTDIAVLVVAADDGVMPQTVEAINHAKAAGIEIIVAVNKIDKPNANVERVKQELTEHELIATDWGGSTEFVPVSAKAGTGIEELLETILLTAEILELKANPNRNARGVVIEAELDKGRGPVATVLVQKGTLRVGNFISAGSAYGKVRAMIDDKGQRVKEATPSTPVEILGLSDVPSAGEVFIVHQNDKTAKSYAETYLAQHKEEMLAETKQRMSLDDLFNQIQEGNLKELNLIVKADVQGSVEAVKQSLTKLSNEEVVVKCIHGGVGAINESDVILASASNAIIIGFNVRPDAMAKATAEREGVDLRLYKVIYQAIEDVQAAMKGMLDPVFEEKVIGHAEVRQIFKASAVGNIAGSYVLDGMFQRNCKIRISREGEQIFEGELASLKRFKDDVKEVKAGFECGLVFEGFDQMQELDIVEAYIMVEVPR